MRVGEIDSMEFDGKYITCVSEKTRKGRKDVIRKIPLSPMLKRVMPLIDLEQAKAVSRYTIRDALKRIFPDRHIHELRYTFITRANVCTTKVYLSPIMDLYNNEIMSYSISLHPDLAQIREMLDGLSKNLPKGATPILHSDQGWQYQHAEYQRYLKEHNITQSMSRKGNCMDNGAMECFFGRLKVEMFYGEKFESVEDFMQKLREYISYWNNERISLKLKGMSPVGYRTHSHTI